MYVKSDPGVQPREQPDVHANFIGFLKTGAQVTVNAGTRTNSSGEWAETTVGFIRLKHLKGETGPSTGCGDDDANKRYKEFLDKDNNERYPCSENAHTVVNKLFAGTEVGDAVDALDDEQVKVVARVFAGGRVAQSRFGVDNLKQKIKGDIPWSKRKEYKDRPEARKKQKAK